MTRLRALSGKKRIGLGVAVLALLFVAFLAVGYALTKVPQPNSIATAEATTLTYNDGTVMGKIGKNRTLVDLALVSQPARKAVLAAEDRRFYSEPGISFTGIGRALYANIAGGGVSQGGSTITQQYAKNAFLTQQRTYTRKVKEVFLALKISKTVSKDKVLEDYLNTIYFGRGAYGIQAASQTYFHKSAKDLTATEGAVLASSINSPSGDDPQTHPERARARWSYVLDGMVKSGWLTAQERSSATYPKVLPITSGGDFQGYKSYVKAQVLADLGRHGISEDQVSAGGLVVKTTLRRGAQEAARAAVENRIPAASGANPPVGALVAVAPGTGAVVAYYGGRDAGGLDYADSPGPKGVEPGSSMKPYVLATALEKGKSLDTMYDGASPQTVCGQVENNDQGDPPLGQITLTEGLEKSVNTVYIRLACDVGPKNVVALAHAAGIPSSVPLDGEGSPSIQVALGSGGYEVHVIEPGRRVRDVRRAGHARGPVLRRVGERQGRPRALQGQAQHELRLQPGRGRRHHVRHAEGRRVRYGDPGAAGRWTSCRGQDRYHHGEQERLVLRLHPPAVRGGVGRPQERRLPAGGAGQHRRRLRRDRTGGDLEGVHGRRAAGAAEPGLPAPCRDR